MDQIKLIFAENVVARRTERTSQRLVFSARVANLAFEKHVDVHWAGEDGVWHVLPAQYQHEGPDGEEYWTAKTELTLGAGHPIPGDVEFALRYRVLDQEYWDNNDGHNHSTQADCGVELAPGVAIADLGALHAPSEATLLPVAVAVDARVEAQRVTVHWTTDGWRTTRQSSCRLRRDYWEAELRSKARNPNQNGTQIWDAQLTPERASSAQYRVACEAGGQTLWDDIGRRPYRIQPRTLPVLVLNLHCYQEENQTLKFRQIAKAIDELKVDVICFQEVAELWNEGKGDWASNSARIINQHLRKPYHLATDWAHLGFGRYREGVAVLSRHPIVRQEARYVSSSHDPYSIHSRKVVLAQVNVPFVGLLNVFCAHLSWWEDGFSEQFENLRRWARDEHTRQVKATLLCGDFNIEAGSRGYELVVDSGEYEDSFLAATKPSVFAGLLRNRADKWHEHLHDDHRIDYVFVRKESGLRVVGGRELFTERDFGRVSDHTGYLCTFAAR
jgi:maltose 6'-phosphate phosphatase